MMLRILFFILVICSITLNAQNWQQLNFNTNSTTVQDIAVSEDTSIYVAENSYHVSVPNQISKSTDFGSTWTLLGSFPKADIIRNITLDEAGNLYVTIWYSDSSGAEILVYKDSAAGFQPQLHDSRVKAVTLVKFLKGVGYATGARCPVSSNCSNPIPVLYKRAAGDSVWRALPLPLSRLRGLEMLDSNKLYVWNSDSIIFYSADGGKSWIARTSPLQAAGDFLGKFHMQNDSVGYSALNNTDLYRTADSAKSWTLVSNLSINGLITTIESYKGFVIVGTSGIGEIAYTRDNATTWTIDAIYPVGLMQAISATQAGIFVGQLASLHYHNSSIYTGSIGGRELPKFHGKLHLFPNPANEVLYINSPSIEYYSIFTMRGECVLKGEVSDDGINIASLSKGVYIFRARDIDGFIYFKRFVVQL